MSDLKNIISKYSIKHDKKIKGICTPLIETFNVPYFTYSFLEADGTFGYLTNAFEFSEYYFDQGLHLENPYYSHPALFRSGNTLLPCSLDEDTQKKLRHKFKADHFFLNVQATPSKMECFVFANENVSNNGDPRYLPHLDMLIKFGKYFKKEAKDLVGRMKSDRYNIQKLRGEKLFENPGIQVPLLNSDPKIRSFLKKISGLSLQESRCLELFQQGNSAQATAAILGLSRRTVEHYFESIKNKLDCNSKFDLLNY